MKLPKLIGLKPIKKLAYWRFVKMRQCLLAGSYREYGLYQGSFGEELTTKPLVLGNLFHESLEKICLLAKNDDLNHQSFKAQFNSAIDTLEEKISKHSSYRHLGDIHVWPEIAQMYRTLVVAVDKELERNANGYELRPEQELYSRDRTLFGVVDGLFLKEGSIAVVDYKFGAIEESGELKPDYVDQLQFYSYLVRENFERSPDSLALVDKELNWIEVPKSEGRSEELASDMRSVLARYNFKLERGDSLETFATPSSGACDGCDAKVICQKFKNDISRVTVSKYRHIVWGKQIGKIRKSTKGIAAIEIEVETGTVAHPKLLLGRLFLDRFPELQDISGQRLAITNIKHESTIQNAVGEFSAGSRIFTLGDVDGE